MVFWIFSIPLMHGNIMHIPFSYHILNVHYIFVQLIVLLLYTLLGIVLLLLLLDCD